MFREFDPGSGSPLAVRLMHASRARTSGLPEGKAANGLVTREQPVLEWGITVRDHCYSRIRSLNLGCERKPRQLGLLEGLASYQVVGEVMAHQAEDG